MAPVLAGAGLPPVRRIGHRVPDRGYQLPGDQVQLNTSTNTSAHPCLLLVPVATVTASRRLARAKPEDTLLIKLLQIAFMLLLFTKDESKRCGNNTYRRGTALEIVSYRRECILTNINTCRRDSSYFDNVAKKQRDRCSAADVPFCDTTTLQRYSPLCVYDN